MFLRKTNTYLSFFGNRVYVLYIAAILLVIMLTDVQSMFNTMKLRVLNRLMPPLQFLVSDKEYPEHRNKWEDFAYYYDKVKLYVPALSNAYMIAGYSRYQLGDIQSAQENFQAAIDINPHFLWAHYNLGIVQFENGEFEKASESFDRAISTKMEANLGIMLLSKVYQQIIVVNGISKEVLAQNLQQGLTDAAIMKIKCLLELEKNNEAFGLAIKIQELGWNTQGQASYYAGLAALKLNKIPLAIYYFRDCVEKNKQFAESYHYLGNLLLERSETDLPQTLLAQAKHLESQGVSPLKRPFRPRIY